MAEVRNPSNGGKAFAQFISSSLRIWPALALIVGWAISVELRMTQIPDEIPPEWFRKEVATLSAKLDALDGKVDVLAQSVIETRGEVKSNRELIVRLENN